MTSIHTDVVIRTHCPGQVPSMLDTIADLWSDAHPEIVNTPGATTDGLSATTVRRQITDHLRHEGFILVAAYADGSMVGFGYAIPCTPQYWYGALLPHIPEHVRAGRLMALCELAVTPARQSQGIGSRLHTELLKAINPGYASLLVRSDNTVGRTRFEHLDCRHAGPCRDEPGGTVYDLLLLHVDRAAR
ncbi:N-acetyltransferase family protein [Streptomyces sp. NPDC055210]